MPRSSIKRQLTRTQKERRYLNPQNHCWMQEEGEARRGECTMGRKTALAMTCQFYFSHDPGIDRSSDQLRFHLRPAGPAAANDQ